MSCFLGFYGQNMPNVDVAALIDIACFRGIINKVITVKFKSLKYWIMNKIF